jgi:hypothetical protein
MFRPTDGSKTGHPNRSAQRSFFRICTPGEGLARATPTPANLALNPWCGREA